MKSILTYNTQKSVIGTVLWMLNLLESLLLIIYIIDISF